MKYAVISFKGKQYKVEEGQEILVPLSRTKEKIEFEDVLLVVDDGQLKLGKPNLAGSKITARYLGEERGEKIRVFKYKAKSRYRKSIGSRQTYSKLIIDKIS